MGWLMTRNGRLFKMARKKVLVRRARGLEDERHRRAHGEQRRRDHHQQEVLGDVGLEIHRGERGRPATAGPRSTATRPAMNERVRSQLHARPRAESCQSSTQVPDGRRQQRCGHQHGKGPNCHWVKAAWALNGTRRHAGHVWHGPRLTDPR